MRRGRVELLLRAALGGVLVPLALVTTAEPARPHAVVEQVEPADGERLSTGPSEVRITFSEPVDADLGGLRVVSSGGERVDLGETVSIDGGRVLRTDLRSDLERGTYVITFRVVSADGHPIRGSTVFGIGEDVDRDSVDVDGVFASDDRAWEVAGAVARWVAYVGLLVSGGLTAGLVLLLRRAEPSAWPMLRASALVGLLGAAALLPVQAALASGRGLDGAWRPALLRDVASGDLGRQLLCALVGVLLMLLTRPWGDAGARSSPRNGMALLGALLAVTSFAWWGHTTATDPVWLSSIVDASHLVAVAAWLGGLVLLLVGAREDEDRPLLVARFRTYALLAVVPAGLSGSFLAWSQVRSLDGLIDTTYGRTLLVKLVLLGVVAILAVISHERTHPARVVDLDADGAGSHAGLGTRVRTEVLGLVVVLAVTAVLVNVTPARTLTGAGPFDGEAAFGAGSAQLVIDPAEAGVNEIHLYLFDETGLPLALADDLVIRFSLPDRELGPIERQPVFVGSGHYQLTGDELSIPGTWTVELAGRISRFEEATATFTVPIS